MQTAIREYDAKLDSKRRLTLRSTSFEYYHVQEMDNGTIVLEPRELTVPFQVSANTLAMMDASVRNMKAGNVSAPIGLEPHPNDKANAYDKITLSSMGEIIG